MSMRKKYSGSVVRANPVVPTEDSASGIWTLDQQNQNQKRGTWPFVGDPNFKDTVLLLHGDTSQTPSSESQSADNQEVRLIGDAKATNWNPFNLPEGYWSNYFDGDNNYLSISNIPIGTQPYTFECFVFITSGVQQYQGIFSAGATNASSIQFQLSNELMRLSSYSAQILIADAGDEVPLNTWTHLAFVRDSSNVLRFFKDGVLIKSGTDSTNWSETSADMLVGRIFDSSTHDFEGYISNLHFVVGTAKYTASFSKPTAPITPDVNTKLLTCQSNGFNNKSADGGSLGSVGDAEVATFSPFSYTPTATENNYGSYYFDGSTTQVAYPSNVDEFTFGTGDFHYEFWLYPTGGSGVQRTLIGRDSTTDANSSYIYLTSGNHFNWYLTSSINLGSSTLIYLYSWYHLVVSRKDGTLRLFVNGEQKNSAANTTSMIDPVHTTIGSGGTAGTQHPFTGYIYNVIVKRKGVDSVTVPTKPTELTLTEGENSVYFDGTGDYLEVPATTDHDFGTGDFTVEFWLFPGETLGFHIYLSAPQNTSTQIGYDTGNGPRYLYFYNGSNIISGTGASSMINNQWNHVVVVREGTTVALFSNGNRLGTATHSDNVSFSNLNIGRYHVGGYDIISHMSNVRLVKGTAIYDTSSTTYNVPTAPSPATNGVLLACASRYIEDRSPANNDIAANGNAVVSGFNPFNDGYWSNYFDGSGDYFQVNSFSHTLSGQWSWECWVYKLDTGVDVICSDNSLDNFQVALTSPNISFQYGGSERFNVSTGFNQNVWYHICITRDGSNNIRCFINGVLKAYVASMSSNPVLGVLNIGRQDNSGSTAHPTYAYLSNLRFVIGSIPTGYQTSETSTGTSIFTSPTDVLTTSSQGATSSDIKLLTCQSNRFLDNSASSHGITVSGNTSIDESIPFELPSRQTKLLAVHNNQDVNNNSFQDSSLLKNFITRTGNVAQGTFSPFSAEDGYWSVFIDDSSSNARLEFPDSTDFAFASGQAFTVECFIYLLQKTAGDHIYMTAANGGFALKIDSTGNNLAAGTYSGSEPALTRVKGAVSIGTWHHIVYVRDSSNTASFFVDGTRTETTTDSTSYAQQAARVGCTTVNPCHAYINNLRVTRSEVYDASSSSLTVPTIPLSALANTVLLTCQSNRFVDNSSDARVPSIISSNNTPKVQPYAPFAPRRSYSKEVVGGSAYFDGTEDRLTVVDGASIGAGDFTISAWVYRTANGTFPVILDTRSADGDTKPVLYTNGAALYYYTGVAGTGAIRITGSSAINNNEWIFVRLVKESNVTKLFVNGTQVGSDYADTNNYSPINDWEIGSRHTNEHYWFGYISNLQVVLSALDGTSVPTAPFTSDENTRLLLNSTDGAVIDNTGKNNFETQDNTIASPYIKKFGNGSVLFSGETLEITTTTNPNLALGSGEFTVEFWFYSDTASATQGFMGSYSAGWWFQYFGNWQFGYSNTAIINHTQAYNAKQWYFIAVTRDSSNVVGLYIDGTRVSNATNTTDLVVGSTFAIGGIDTSGTRDATAKLDEVRITKGVARYTGTSHVVPIRAFKNR